MCFAWLYAAALAASFAAGNVLFDTLLKEAGLRYSAAGTSLAPEELADRVTRSLRSASELLDLELPFEEGGCAFDFSAFCPEGWVPSGDGIHCELLQGDASNAGLCGRLLDMRGKSPLDKLSLSEMCDIKWPCVASRTAVPESDSVCPKFWSRTGDECLADATYAGPCSSPLKLVGKSRQEREDIARTCNLVFPRTFELLDEASDWSADCPLGWSLQEDGFCVQNSEQSSGPCGRRLKFEDRRDKRKKTKLCSLVWPIKTEQVDAFCPLGWRYDQDNELCLAPSSYTVPRRHMLSKRPQGPCQLRVNFSHYSTEDKALWAHVCGASFLSSGDATEPPKSASDVSYRNGPLDHSLSVVRFGKNVTDVRVMERQLDELRQLRKKSSDPLFLKTIDKSIATLRSQLKTAATGAASFIQLASMALTPDSRSCPYGWRQFNGVCVASETYGRVVPGCKTVRPVSDDFGERCRVSTRSENVQEDFVRPHCPLNWATRKVYFANLVRHLCIAPLDFGAARREECGGATLDFSARSPGFKRRWAFACGQKFPDFTDEHPPKCVENFFWRCPAEWEHNGDACVAPRHYRGPCPASVPVSELSSDSLKAAFSRRCFAAWPCLGHCNKDYASVGFKPKLRPVRGTHVR
ncbi:CPW-WPC family protein, putative [Babesia caballi]|uniref:CPW-WPC family protein, putative n=1 Tax=Babesia caballi TaxID=5871 RepID=A0AAV4LVT0_BABCB|nr:CPW-WPC family protein, putative [Babesia caballi]